MALDRFPPNPGYGDGVYRRRLMLAGQASAVSGELFDDYHHMRCRVAHDGTHVIDAAGELVRFPFSTCSGAGVALRELVGMRLDAGADLYRDGRPQRNCTHLFDLAATAMRFAPAQGDCTIDIEIEDGGVDGAAARALLDGKLVHDWRLTGETMVSPYPGRSLFGGFVAWARAHFDGLELQAALHLQKGALTARARRYIVDSGGGGLTDEPNRVGSCFSFTEPQFSAARRLRGYARDLSGGFPEDLS